VVRRILWALLGLAPVTIVAHYVLHPPDVLEFALAALALIPLAWLIGEATEHAAHHTGPGIGGFLNVTFGNAPELIIAFFALNEGLQEVVKASLVGSILGNILLVMGAAMLVGGWKRERQTFNQTAATAQSAMLLLAAIALFMPAVFQLVHGDGLPGIGDERVEFGSDVESLSIAVAVILLVSYAGGLLFSLRTHRDLFNPETHSAEGHGGGWSVRKAVLALAGAGLAVGLMSEILVGSISEIGRAHV
jgi:Ca2+:H+ antiporter